MFKGQAFDTFKLMIAAVIAVAILGILLGIIANISPSVTQKPVEVSQSILNRALDAPCAPIPSGDVNFKATDGWTKATFEKSSGYRITSLTTTADASVSALFTGATGNVLASAKQDFPGGITARCNGLGACALVVYTSSTTNPTIPTLAGC